MKKIFTIVAASALLAGPVLFATAYADPADDNGRAEHHRFSAENFSAYQDARIAGLKAGLRLTPDQEKNWAPVEAALRDAAKARLARIAAWREKRKERDERPDALARLGSKAEHLARRSEEIKTLAAAAGPLYKSLDDAQKQRFAVLLHMRGNERGKWQHNRG
jgi:LTXXQ motif family protein